MQLPRLLRKKVFDGELLARNLQAFLARIDTALAPAAAALPNHEIDGIEVSLTIDAGLNIGFAGMGATLDRDRTITFTLKPKSQKQ